MEHITDDRRGHNAWFNFKYTKITLQICTEG